MVKIRDTDALERFTRSVFTQIISGLSLSLKEQQLSVPQVATLFLLDAQSPRTLSEISVAVGLSMSAASRMIDSLVKEGLVTRKEGETDRRQKLLANTPAATRLIERAGAERVRTVQRAAAHLPEEAVAQVLRALAEITKR